MLRTRMFSLSPGTPGRMVQMQNLPRNYLKTLDYARNLVKDKNYALVRQKISVTNFI